MEYKIGDVVRIKDNLQVGKKYGECSVTEKMLKFKGTTNVIDAVYSDEYYALESMEDLDGTNYYLWHGNMLEPVVPIKQVIPMNDLESVKMDRLGIYQYLLNNLQETYEAKNNDYGNSVTDTYEKFGDASFLVRITNKYNELLTLYNPNIPEQKVKDEMIDDTILDLANYCLLWLVERECKNQQEGK